MEIVVESHPFVPTRRQIEVLAARAAGGSRKDAARILGVGDSTVRYHLGRLLLGLHAHDDAQAIYMMRREIAALIAGAD